MWTLKARKEHTGISGKPTARTDRHGSTRSGDSELQASARRFSRLPDRCGAQGVT
ncbi:hypothetical protein TBKG_00052 [Mycobacterium tuberculosis '98-R604 INH-RIF-EM']|uniref:Uncharacterized protein SocB n=2 Tax=Mycobacterium tuberculosis TaxID=1773 RepID=SOCB_MYCTU|nr:RecName: Full=Uncharacterized protein SocB; AltName: Full=Small ORF induced by copper B [Mycobacterium tuberculosis H37Rv]AAK46016.1 hypothetical protein MT1746.1 [Mycobacterium tuberculosis CDC1551]AKR01431.1 hypothetical protein Mb1595_p1908 [Mycobacterium tuberculosis variant bovis]EFD47158.1 conserved hypothetical protein [Mycobacterium tuberculosis T17]EFD58278.1 conserved hypothetical protein [Mycobacterium tuberculosis T92]EPZ64715.1 hypothetical protein TBKG_00052 [Mycobacterium tub